MIDLSYLTEEEKGMILAVLKRDQELKKLEEQRIKQLRKTEKDKSRLKYLTGEWFYETNYNRHRDTVHGSDIIRASMKQRKPVTILELTQRWAEKPSFVNSANKDVYIPPELSGLIEDPSTQPLNERVDKYYLEEVQQERQRPQIKPRQNPFNSVQSQRDADRLINGVKETDQTPAEESLRPAQRYTQLPDSNAHHTIINTNNTDTQFTVKPVPKKRQLLFSCRDSLLDTSICDLGSKQVVTPPPRGILKHTSSDCSSSASLRLHMPTIDDSCVSQSSAPVSPISLETPFSPPLYPRSVHCAPGWLDRKQVHFSIIPGSKGEHGMHRLLDEDWRFQDRVLDRYNIAYNDRHKHYDELQTAEVSYVQSTAEVKAKTNQLGTEGQTHKITEDEGRSISKVFEWFGRGSQEGKLKKLKESPVQKEKNKEEAEDQGASDTKSTVVQPKNKPSPKPRRGFFAFFSRADHKDRSPENIASDKAVISQDKTEVLSLECETPCNFRLEADESIVLKDSNTEESNKTGRPECEDAPQKETIDQGEISQGRLANLKSFWESGNRGPKILSIKKTQVQESETSQPNRHDQNALDTSEYPVDVESTKTEISPSKTSNGVNISAISLNEPLDLDSNKVSEVTSSELQAHTVKPEAIMPSPSSLLKHNIVNAPVDELDEESMAESLSRDIFDLKKEISTFTMSLSQQDNKVSISDLKSFWEKEKPGLKIIVGTSASIPDGKFSSPESSPKRSSVGLSTSPFEIRSTSPDLMSSQNRGLSLNSEFGLFEHTQKEKMEESEEKQSPSRGPAQDPQDIKGRASYITQNTSNFEPQPITDKHSKPSLPSSSPLRSLPGKGQHDSQQPTDIYQPKDQQQSRTPSPLRQSKVPSRDSYPNKESRKDGSPLRTFVIDINPANRSQCADKVKTGQIHEEVSSRSLNVIIEKLGRTDWPDESQMSPPQDSSELRTIPQFSNTPLHTRMSNIDDFSGQDSSPFCGSVLQCTSQEHHGKTLEGSIDIGPIMPKERTLLADFQSNTRLARSYIPLSLQHYLGVPNQTVSDATERLDQVKVQTGEAFEQVNQGKVSNESSPSRHSQPESEEITFDSSGSSTPEAWSFSHTSSPCDSDENSSVKAALDRGNARPISISKSLEDLGSMPALSANTPTIKMSFSDPEQMKMISMSVPAFLQQETDCRYSDCASERSFSSDRLRCNTPTNFSICSDAPSTSSVTGSVMSVYSSEFGNVEVKGTIQLAIHYLQKLEEFHIFVVQCKDLAVADPKRNRSDPYVKCYLLPDKVKYGKKKTCVRKKTQDPTYNEILRFKIPMETLLTQKLNLSVWHNDTFGRNSFLGEVDIDLAQWDFNNTQINEYMLKGRVLPQLSPKHSVCSEEMKGEMRVALRFLAPSSQSHKNKVNGEVQIWVKECRNLPLSRGVVTNPFVKCTVLPDNSRKSRQKTRVVKKSSNPVFNHTMVYDGFRPEDLKEACAEITVWGHDRLSNHFIGGIRLGPGTGKSYGADVDWMDSNGAEAAIWDRMMQSPNEWVEDIIPLRMLAVTKQHL